MTDLINNQILLTLIKENPKKTGQIAQQLNTIHKTGVLKILIAINQ